LGRYVDALLLRLFQTIGRVCIGLPPFTVARALLGKTPERHAVAEADIVDLQYSESIRLARLIRRINPSARIVGTFHDVQSQVIARHPVPVGRGWLAWRVNAWQIARAERHAFRWLDDVVVFSQKDADLLPGPCRVIKPPLAAASAPSRAPHPADDPASPPVVLMVGVLARPENDVGATWLVDEVWPMVRSQVPAAQLRIAGSGASPTLDASAASQPGVRLTGFVEDLEAEYAAASVIAVPLHSGAGVKFKTIEAMVRGIPVVTTPVGAEGIGDIHLYAGHTDDPRVFAEALVGVLSDQRSAFALSRSTAAWAAAEFGTDQFVRGTEASYGVREWLVPENVPPRQ
jgi:glycosyltransferase involved in cell wall biosynthesis